MEFVEDAPPIEEEHVQSWQISPDDGQKGRIIDEVICFLGERMTLVPPLLFKYRLCLDEALTNSIRHGCAGLDLPKIQVELFWSPESWAIRILDDGPGFTADCLLDLGIPGSEVEETGRGVLILRQYTDRLVYSRGGCEQTFWMMTRGADG